MKSEYDLSKLKSKKNPHVSQLKKPVTIRMGSEVIDYFKNMAGESGVPYQTLINLYLQDCASQGRRLKISWPENSGKKPKKASEKVSKAAGKRVPGNRP